MIKLREHRTDSAVASGGRFRLICEVRSHPVVKACLSVISFTFPCFAFGELRTEEEPNIDSRSPKYAEDARSRSRIHLPL